MPLAIFCNNPLSVSIVFERRAKYSGAIFKDSLHFQWWVGNFNFTFERVQHTFNENPAWSDIFLLNDITYKKILRYIFQVQSPNSRSHHVIRARRSKRVVRNVVKTLFIVKREARENKEPTPHAPPPLCFEFFFWIANNLKKAILFCCTKQSDKSNNCYVVSFRNIERNLVSKLLDVGWEHSRSNKVLWGIGPAFRLENWGVDEEELVLDRLLHFYLQGAARETSVLCNINRSKYSFSYKHTINELFRIETPLKRLRFHQKL